MYLCRWLKSLTWMRRVVNCCTLIHRKDLMLFRKPDWPVGRQTGDHVCAHAIFFNMGMNTTWWYHPPKLQIHNKPHSWCYLQRTQVMHLLISAAIISRVSDQNGISWLCIIVEIYHCGQKPSTYKLGNAAPGLCRHPQKSQGKDIILFINHFLQNTQTPLQPQDWQYALLQPHTNMHCYSPIPICTATAPYQYALLQPHTNMHCYSPIPICTATAPYQYALLQPHTNMHCYSPIPICTATAPYQYALLQPQGAARNAMGPQCHRAAMPRGRNATGPQCHGAAMAPWHCGL